MAMYLWKAAGAGWEREGKGRRRGRRTGEGKKVRGRERRETEKGNILIDKKMLDR